MRRVRLAVLGGTFDHLHVGHHTLLATAFRTGREVAVGLTTDDYISAHPKPGSRRIQPYSVRRACLVRWIRQNYPRRSWRVTPLENRFGRSVDPEVGALVVSGDTEEGGRAVNRERRRLGRAPVPLVVVPLVLADDLEPVSSRRVRAGEIGPDGRRIAPIRVAVAAGDPVDRVATQRAVLRVFPRARITDLRPTHVPSGRAVSGRRRPASPPPYDLALRVTRRRPSGWTVAVSTARVRLRPRKIRGSRRADLERGLRDALRPRL